MAKKTSPTQKRSDIVKSAIEKLYADAKAALSSTSTEIDPVKLAQAAQIVAMPATEAEKVLTREFWIAKIAELGAERDEVQAKINATSPRWSELVDEAETRREAWIRANDALFDLDVERLVESYRAYVTAEKALPALREERETLRSERDAIDKEIEAGRAELRSLSPKAMSTVSMSPPMAVDVGLGGRAIVEPPDSSSTWRFA